MAGEARRSVTGSEALPIVLIGAGGHSKVVIDACRAAGKEIAGLVADDMPAGTVVSDIRVIADMRSIADAAFLRAHLFHVAVGDQGARRRIATDLIARGARLVTLVHPSAVVSPCASIGDGTVLVAGAIVNAGSRVGRFCILNTACSVDHDNVLEDGCHICSGARLAGRVLCGEGAFVGTGAIVIPGISIGARAIIGAGAVVIRDVPADAKVVGCPAKPIS